MNMQTALSKTIEIELEKLGETKRSLAAHMGWPWCILQSHFNGSHNWDTHQIEKIADFLKMTWYQLCELAALRISKAEK